MKPKDIPQAEPADAEIAVADEKKSSRREAEEKIAPQPANAMAQKKAPTVGQTQTSPLIAVGRPLLRLLEHGDGPRIDISWPTDPHERSALFDTFERCYGMVVALVAESGDLYSDRSSAAPWEINLDYYSGFVRQSGRLSTPRERDWSRRIVQRHPSAAGKLPVRVFPRQTDALLMGGLHELLRRVLSIDEVHHRSLRAFRAIRHDCRHLGGRAEHSRADRSFSGSSPELSRQPRNLGTALMIRKLLLSITLVLELTGTAAAGGDAFISLRDAHDESWARDSALQEIFQENSDLSPSISTTMTHRHINWPQIYKPFSAGR